MALKAASGSGNQTSPSGLKKRQRDDASSSLDRFKREIYGVNGFQRLMAMVERNPVIMYPPIGCAEARERALMLGLEAHPTDAANEPAGAAPVERFGDESAFLNGLGETDGDGRLSGPVQDELPLKAQGPKRNEEEADFLARLLALRESRQQQQQLNNSPPAASAAAADEPAAVPAASTVEFAELNETDKATYHRRQLSAFITTLYEFNHLTFSKMQMRDLLLQLLRCKESYGHVSDFENRIRIERFGTGVQLPVHERSMREEAVALGRESYFEDQLVAAEKRAAALGDDGEGDGAVWGASPEVLDEDEIEDDGLWEELRRKQARLEDFEGAGDDDKMPTPEKSLPRAGNPLAVQGAPSPSVAGIITLPSTHTFADTVPPPESAVVESTVEACGDSARAVETIVPESAA
jgi:hypothetical protein